MNGIFLRRFNPVPRCKKEILRYAGVKGHDSSSEKLLEECLKKIDDSWFSTVYYTELGVKIEGNKCDFDSFCVVSKGLAQNLEGCDRVKLMVATVGFEIDRLIEMYSRISPSKAVMYDAIGTDMVEQTCNLFCSTIEREEGVFLKPRFSPGYGDLSLSVQKDIFNVFGSKNIGLILDDSLLMHPTKSVTAFAGITNVKHKTEYNKCSQCTKTDCVYRGI